MKVDTDKPIITDNNGRNRRGRFAIGNTGRPKGAVNKTTRELRETINEFLSNNLDKIQDDYDQLEPKEKLLFIDKMLKHVLPSKVEEIVDTKPKAIVIKIESAEQED